MQDFSNYPYIIQIQNLESTIRKIHDNGFNVPISLVINGEYYAIDFDGSKLKNWEQNRKG